MHDILSFILDERLENSCFTLLDWPLSRILLKNNVDYPWLILVPRKPYLTEITDLSPQDNFQLMQEVSVLTRVVQNFFKPNKINLGSLGNIVPQFHFHVVGRFHSDPLWPQGIWQSAMIDKPYMDPQSLIEQLRLQLEMVGFGDDE